MSANLDRRLQALEASAAPADSIRIIAIQIVSPGNLEAANHCCRLDGKLHWRQAGEDAEEFEDRMRAMAIELNRVSKRVIQIVCSPTDLTL